jgi:hypothetical protein
MVRVGFAAASTLENGRPALVSPKARVGLGFIQRQRIADRICFAEN